MRVLVTGSRDWTDRATIERALAMVLSGVRPEHGPTTLVHGACPYGGADIIAAEIWEGWGLPVEPHPADWKRYGKAAGPRRNQEMVDAGADVCLAFPLPTSRGTHDCAERARAAGMPILWFHEEGQ